VYSSRCRTFVWCPLWTLQNRDQTEEVIVALRLKARDGGGWIASIRVELFD
jgi:hypothetical protein